MTFSMKIQIFLGIHFSKCSVQFPALKLFLFLALGVVSELCSFTNKTQFKKT